MRDVSDMGNRFLAKSAGVTNLKLTEHNLIHEIPSADPSRLSSSHETPASVVEVKGDKRT